jgi:ABC-2 type transport system permease protein
MIGVAREANAIITIAFRDILKFLRDPSRLVGTLVLPIIFIGALGGSLQANVGKQLGYDFLLFTFTGIFAQTLFQSTAFGLISLIEDRENDFSQEIFISPISRYSIVFGKILGESLVALTQAIAVIGFGVVIHVPFTSERVLGLIAVGVVVCLLGGAFGLILLSGFGSQRAANQILPFLVFPQFFLGGVFTPIQHLPPYIDILSRISPLRYAVDLTPDYTKVVLHGPGTGPLANLLIIGVIFTVFLFIGTMLFVRSEHNR